jgi:hypothetical protein
MPNNNSLAEWFKVVEEKGWWCSYLTTFIHSAGSSIEKQKQALHRDLPLQIYLSLDDESRLQNIKAAIKRHPDLIHEMAIIMGNLAGDKLFKNLRDDQSKILKQIVNEINKSLSDRE